MKLRDQLSLSEIARRTGLARNTVKKWLKAPGDVVPKYERIKQTGKLTAFEPILQQALSADSHRLKQGRRGGRALFAQIQAQGYRGGYSAVTEYIRRWRFESASSPTKAFVPLSFELGAAFQFDWSDEVMVIGGVFYNTAGGAFEAMRQSRLLVKPVHHSRQTRIAQNADANEHSTRTLQTSCLETNWVCGEVVIRFHSSKVALARAAR